MFLVYVDVSGCDPTTILISCFCITYIHFILLDMLMGVKNQTFAVKFRVLSFTECCCSRN